MIYSELPLMTANAHLFKGKRVLLRLDLNVPITLGEIRNDYRIRESLPTLSFLRSHGARVVIVSHIGKGKPEDTLAPVAEYLSRSMPILFMPSLTDDRNIEVTERMQDGDVVLVENLRHGKGEEENDDAFADMLASWADYYVNDAFSVSHRAHASVVGVTKRLPSFAGMRLAEEAAELSRAFEPSHPFLFILGGAKIGTKMPLLKKFLDKADSVFVGGAIANNFIKAGGNEIGASLYDPEEMEGLAQYVNHPKLIIPSDVVVKSGGGNRIANINEVAPDEMIVDIGRDTIAKLERVIGEAKLIIWNGPLGFYEEGYTEGSRELLERMLGASGYSIIGGGDTVALVESMGNLSKFGFVSTGGGAMLDYLANESLPALDALVENAKK